MRNLYLTLLIILSAFQVNAQAPESFQYQAIVRADDGSILSERNVTVRFKLKQGDASGSTVFIEKHDVKTNKAGIINLQVGKGTNEHGIMAQVNWGNGPYFIETEIDKGDGFVSIGTQQLLSVPYAQYAKNTENVQIKSPNGKVWNIIIDNEGNVSSVEVTQ